MQKLLFTFITLIVLSNQSIGQIKFHDVDPDTTVSTWDAFTITPIASGPSDYIVIWWHPSPEVVVQTWGNCEILFDAQGTLPLKLEQGDTIDASGKWVKGNYDALSSGGSGNWTSNALDKYLGFRVKNGTTWNYGWVKMSVASAAVSFTIKEWAYDTTGNAIKAGQKTATAISNIQNKTELQVYPNPAQNRIVVSKQLNDKVAVHDLAGRRYAVYQQTEPGQTVLDITHLPAGTYILTSGNYIARFTKVE